MNEARLQRRLRSEIGAVWPRSWTTKFHGSGFTAPGVPDVLGVVEGRFVGLETKVEGRPTLVQMAQLQRIRDAGGIGLVVYDVDKAIESIGRLI